VQLNGAAVEVDISFTPLHGIDEGEVKADPLSEFHLAPATFETLEPHPLTVFRMSWIALDRRAQPYGPDTATSLMVISWIRLQVGEVPQEK
jgi:hypothetical protein